jgi:transposase
MKTTQPNTKKERGVQIANKYQIKQIDSKCWEVPSQSKAVRRYKVKVDGKGTTCNCKDFTKHRGKCKHIYAVEYSVTGSIEEPQVIKRKTYSQDWPNYNKAQKEEKQRFMEILSESVNTLEDQSNQKGRPKKKINNIIYSMIFKVYSQLSGRRFTSDMVFSLEKGYISENIPFTTLKDYFNKEDLTNTLQHIISMTSKPLSEVEKDFAIDSSGFGTSVLQNWSEYKHASQDRYRRWVKCHIVCGVKTNIISAVNITSEFDNDSPEFESLLNKTNENFSIEEFSADKAYLSRKNLNLVNNLGATPYIPFKTHITEKSTHKHGMFWKKMLHYFLYNQEEFMEHYHKRSNVETTFFMIKKKFGENLKSKNWTAQVNELLCKVICHNICVLIHEMFTLNIDINIGGGIQHELLA